MGLIINRKELDEKNKLIDDAIVQLKKEFVGINEQIDSIMNNVRVWFLYSELQITPCIVNLFGMTGCGKTSLIRRIAQLLNIEKDLVYFNFCAINEQSSWQVEDDIESQLNNECSKRIFVYDEFQYAATLDENGCEKDNKNGLKPFWELLDTGILHKKNLFLETRILYKVLALMSKINTLCPMEIVNGKWINEEECLACFNELDRREFMSTFNFNEKDTTVEENCSYSIGMQDIRRYKDSDFFLRDHVLAQFINLYQKAYNIVCEYTEIYSKLCSLNAISLYDLFNDVYEKSLVGYDLKFNQSIIFVIANIDEAYDIAFDVNPDMSPDQFYNITKKISIVDIKKALQKRFRNEQIARLGNIHVIYPSFNSNSFKKIIELHLESYKKNVKKLYGLNLSFDKSINKVIFDEAVFPTQGTRPIFSTIHEFIKAKLPYIIQNIYTNKKENYVNSILYAYKQKKSVISVLDKEGKVIDVYKFTDKFRVNTLRISTKDEQQANTAVHESGHFVIYSYLNGKVPEKIVSRSAEKETSGFMMHDIENKENIVGSKIDYLNEIKVSLGGYVAEGLIFGEDRRSSGASSDLKHATIIASQMVREWGMCEKISYITTKLANDGNGGMLINEENQQYINDKIKEIISMCLKDVESIMKRDNILTMLKKSSKYLLQHSQMPKHIMIDLLEEARKDGKLMENRDTYYRDIVNNF